MNDSTVTDESAPPRPAFRKRWLAWAFILLWASVGTWHVFKPMPPGTDVVSEAIAVAPSDVRFLYDLTFRDPQGQAVHEQQLFDEAFRIIDGARSFIVADFFLFNDFMGAAEGVHRALSRQLADRLIARKRENPKLQILLVTDPINDIYGGAPSTLLQELRDSGIEIAITDLEALRDSNPSYSALWRMFAQWWGNASGSGSMPNPFASVPAKITLRSWLALLNFKANHRKVLIADSDDGALLGLVASANPHDASSAHSNVAMSFKGELAKRVLESELGVARFSGWKGHVYAAAATAPTSTTSDVVQLQYLTEQSIRDHLTTSIDATRNGDSIRMAMFYLSDRKVIDSLLRAAQRGVTVRLILDPNKDAFGRQKDGVPNRPVAHELVSRSDERIQVRWYRTQGEQFHSKMTLVSRDDKLIASLGSANLTRRNIGNYNLEANVALTTDVTSALALEMQGYFDRLWNNDGPAGLEFTAPFGAYRDDSTTKYWRYRFMEATGLSTF